MTAIVIFALLVAFTVYLSVGFILGKHTKGIGDMLPLGFGKQARVANSSEFSASTVATTISLATVVIAFFQLSGQFGVWLFWTVITTSAGLLVVRLFAKRIWERMNLYDHRPTLLEFLGREYNSDALSFVGAACNSLGYMGAFAVELIVGAKFFSALVPEIPTSLVIIALSTVAFIYTAVGGFRAVIVTDRIQMISIWLLLIALPVFYLYFAAKNGGLQQNMQNIPAQVFSFSARPGLIPFLIGILIINVPTFISDMSIWQRIAGADKPETVIGGLWSSVIGSAATWGIFVLLACFAWMIIPDPNTAQPLVGVLKIVGTYKGPVSSLVLFFAVLGLYGAMLSTASTQLIAVSHTVYEDIFSHHHRKKLTERLGSKGELIISRSILIGAAVISTIIVHILISEDFSIPELVFAIYGAQVGLCPLVISALILKRDQLKNISDWAASAVSAGFVIGWVSAIFGHIMDKPSMVFLAPAFSLAISSALLGLGFLVSGTGRKAKADELDAD